MTLRHMASHAARVEEALGAAARQARPDGGDAATKLWRQSAAGDGKTVNIIIYNDENLRRSSRPGECDVRGAVQPARRVDDVAAHDQQLPGRADLGEVDLRWHPRRRGGRTTGSSVGHPA
jgi:hypothetical protein